MSNLKQQLVSAQISAMKAHDQFSLDTIRFVLSRVKNKEIDSQKELIDQDIILILQKFNKELHESLESFKKGGRQDLVEEIHKKIALVQAYLPKQLDDAQLETKIKEIIDKNKELFDKNPKAVMGMCIKELRSSADANRITSFFERLNQ